MAYRWSSSASWSIDDAPKGGEQAASALRAVPDVSGRDTESIRRKAARWLHDLYYRRSVSSGTPS
jgi:hypothetical protein